MKKLKFIKRCVSIAMCQHTPNNIDCKYHGCTKYDCWCKHNPKPPVNIPRYKRIEIIGVEL